MLNHSARYIKIVEWSDEDNCYIGSSPGLFYGGCHGDNEQQVFAELCQIVDEWLEIVKKDGKPLATPATERFKLCLEHFAGSVSRRQCLWRSTSSCSRF